jgi:DNA-binding MarR family transcriptional regulator
VETIAKDLRCSRRSVSRHLQQLEAKGYIAISRSMKDGKRQNVYKIHSDVPILSIRS